MENTACRVSLTSLIVVLPIAPYFLAVLKAATLIREIDGSKVVDTSSNGTSLKYCAVAFSSETVVACGDRARHFFAHLPEMKCNGQRSVSGSVHVVG